MWYVALVDLEEHRKRNLTMIGARRRRGAKKSVFSCICVLLVAMTCSVYSLGRSV